MAKNINHIQHVKSSVVENGKPKLPASSVLVEGEIAVNFADGYETLSIKTTSGNIAAFSSDEYYTEQKLGSGFTGDNSAVTVTDAILWEKGSGNNSVVLKGSSGTASGDYSVAEGWHSIASGNSSHAEGNGAVASGNSSHAEGIYTRANGNSSHAEGNSTIASGDYSHAEGTGTVASGDYSHAEGAGTKASGQFSHAEGTGTNTSGSYSHAEGNGTKANGNSSHAEGQGTSATSESSHAEGQGTIANGDSSHAEGVNTIARGYYSHAEGQDTKASGSSSHAEGWYSIASGMSSHAEGYQTKANGDYSHAEGTSTSATSDSSHAEGKQTKANGNYSHAEGTSTSATSDSSHAEGGSTQANGNYSHAEGHYTSATSEASHAEGHGARAIGPVSHAEGGSTMANGNYSHAEGQGTIASGNISHAEGYYTSASGESSHAEGWYSIANGQYSHAEGYYTSASSESSHAEGEHTITKNKAEHASGRYNVSVSASTTFGDSGNTLFSVGNGTSSNDKHNAFEIRQNGDIYIVNKDGDDVRLQDEIGNIDVDQVIDETTSASTNPVATKAVYDALVDTEYVWANAYVALSGAISSHTDDLSAHGLSGYVASAEYVSTSTTINFKNASGTVISSIDASAFIKDGMVDNVEIKTLSGSPYLVITFNTDSGKEEIDIPLSDIFDSSSYYTKTEIDTKLGSAFTGANSAVTVTEVIESNERVVSSLLNDLNANKLDVSAFTAYSGTVDTAIGSKASQSDLNTLSGTVTAHTASTTLHLNSTEKTNLDSLATNIAAISGITSTKVGNWDTAYTNNHIHSNKSTLDDITASSTAINSLTGTVGTMAFQDASSYSSATEVNTALAGKSDTGHTHDDRYYTESELTGSSTTVVVAKAASATTAASAGSVALANVSDADDLKAIEAIAGTSGLLKKTAANTWALDTTTYQAALTEGRAIDITNNVVSLDLPISAGTGTNAIIEGVGTVASGEYSHAEGNYTSASTRAHSEGNTTYAMGNASHAEGQTTRAKGDNSHAEGYRTSAMTTSSHAEGSQSVASGNTSHAEGSGTHANGNYSHSEGQYTNANGIASHAQGSGTEANNDYEMACGSYNVSNTGSTNADKTIFSVGNGTWQQDKHNAFEIRKNGDVYISSGSTDFKLQDTIASVADLSGQSQTIAAALVELNERLAAIEAALGGFKLQKITQSDYDNLNPKDANTLYIIND